MAHRVIGLDLGSSSVKAAQVLRNDDGSFVVERQAARPIPRGAIYDGRIDEQERGRVSAIIAAMFEEEKFDTKDVVFGLNSSSSTFMNEMTIPVVEEQDYEKAIPKIIEARLSGVDISKNEVAWSLVGHLDTEDGPRMKILVYRTLGDYARETAEVIEKAGLRVVGADLNALAALRAIYINQRPDREADAILDIGANVMTLLLHHNGVPIFLALDPDQAGTTATADVMDALGLDEGDEAKGEFHKINDDHSVGLVTQARNKYSATMANRVGSTLRTAVSRNNEIDSIGSLTIVGGGALLAGIGYYLSQSLTDIPMVYAQVDPLIRGPLDRNGVPQPVVRQESTSGGDYLVAVGLGTGATL